jgi:hypothetical protein
MGSLLAASRAIVLAGALGFASPDGDGAAAERRPILERVLEGLAKGVGEVGSGAALGIAALIVGLLNHRSGSVARSDPAQAWQRRPEVPYWCAHPGRPWSPSDPERPP